MNTRRPSPALAWTRLTAAARRHAAPTAEAASLEAPFGFSARIAARAALSPANSGLLAGRAFERLAARALGCACACAIAATAWSGLPVSLDAQETDGVYASDTYLDPVGPIIEVVQSSS